jgi:hypothetical protein
MARTAVLALFFATSTICLAAPISAQTQSAAGVDPLRLELAETMAGKIIPPGSYQKLMKEMVDQMSEGLIAQMMGIDAAIIAKTAGADPASVEGQSLGDLATQADPHFKERMDIMMKVMFEEMGQLMTAMEPAARSGLARVYARKYDAKQLSEMNAFFATPSGSTFAADFMSTFTDKEMMTAMMGEMPKMMEAMPDIIKKVEAATAHLPPAPKADGATTADTMAVGGSEPWWDAENWAAEDRKKYEAATARFEKVSEQSEKLSVAMNETMLMAAEKAKARYLANGWTAPPARPDPYDPAQLETLKKGWSAEDNAAIAAQTKIYDAVSDTLKTNNRAYNRAQALLYAGYYQAMVNAGQFEDGEKRPAAQAMKEAAEEHDRHVAVEDAAEAATAIPGAN